VFKSLFSLVAILSLLSCNSDYNPKRRGYFRIDFPPHQYQTFDKPEFPYTFEYPVYASVVRDSSYFDSLPENPYWINVDFPRFNARIYISYKEIGHTDRAGPGREKPTANTFDRLRDDAYKMTFKHTVKASSIDDSIMVTPNGVSGVFFRVGGNAATANQFFVTDSVRNFLRGALYFDTAPNEDSLSRVNNFLQADMFHLINTFRWKTPGKGDAGTARPAETVHPAKPTQPSDPAKK
jgi:gliding motility-associated lipoprotein GldD